MSNARAFGAQGSDTRAHAHARALLITDIVSETKQHKHSISFNFAV